MPDKDFKSDDKVLNHVIDGTYKVDKHIGGGAFGSIYSGTDLRSGEVVAIKLEEKDSEAPQLPLEYRFYVLIGQHWGIPRVHHFGPCLCYHALVLELLGPSLEQIHESCKKRFSVHTTAKIALQILEVIEFVHNKRIVFRDVKPDNFLLGLPDSPKASTIHMVDFGLAKEYIDMHTGQHIRLRAGRQLIGTPRYMSTWTHRGRQHSRRDDLESIGFMLIYFVKGRLPWQGLKGKNRYDAIGRIKMQTPIEELCRGLPEQFAQYCSYVRQLEFEEQPDYERVSNLFRSLTNPELSFDWQR